jgi:hypothetical protein
MTRYPMVNAFLDWTRAIVARSPFIRSRSSLSSQHGQSQFPYHCAGEIYAVQVTRFSRPLGAYSYSHPGPGADSFGSRPVTNTPKR